MNSITVEQKFAKVLLSLRDILPYYSTFYEALPKIEDKTINTMGVTSSKLYYSYDFVDKTPIDELIFIVLHEIAHIGLLHPVRIESRDAEIWNIACDLYVNKLLSTELNNVKPGSCVKLKDISITFPKDALYSNKIDVDKDSVDSIYEELIKQKKSDDSRNFGLSGFGETFRGDNIGTGDGLSKDLISSGNTSIDLEEARKLLEDIQVRCDMASSAIGSNPGKLQIKVKEILKSEVDWKKLLSKYCRALKQSTLSFSRPDKRMLYQDSIYPGKHTEVSNYIKGVKVCIDSSGSISDKDIQYFLGQVESILTKYKLDAELIWWDTKIESQGKFSNFKEASRIEASGRGGTDPSCLFEYFDSKECVDKPYVTLVFTDMYWNERKLNNPKWKRKYKDTIWIGTKDKNTNLELPFGKEAVVKRFYE